MFLLQNNALLHYKMAAKLDLVFSSSSWPTKNAHYGVQGGAFSSELAFNASIFEKY